MVNANTASTLSLTLAKRCPRCLRRTRDDGTCQNTKCKLYVEEASEGKENKSETMFN